MNEEELKKRIFTYVRKHNEELQEKTSIQQLAEFLFEVYKSLPHHESDSNKVNYILEQLKDEDDPNANHFTTTDLAHYTARLVKFVERRQRDSDNEDPLEINNLKAVSSANSSDEQEEKHGRLNLHFNNQNDKKHKNQKRDNKSYNRKTQIPQQNQLIIDFINQIQNFSTQPQKYFIYMIQIDCDRLNQLLRQLQPQRQKQNITQDRKDNQVFLLNLPKDQRTFSEIESIFAGKGSIQKIILNVKVPCVQFKNASDAQKLLTNEKYIVYKGVKIEFSSTPNFKRDRPKVPYNEIQKKIKNDDKTEEKTEEKDQIDAPSLLNQQSSQQQQQNDQNKEEKLQQKQLEQMKSYLVAAITDRLRTLLYLSKRKYDDKTQNEIEALKQEFKQKKELVKGYTNLELIKQEYNEQNEKLNHTLIVKDLPQELIANKTIIKELNDTYQVYGKIETLQCQLKEKSALIKFTSLESAEKAYFEVAPKYHLEFQYPSIQKFLIQ